MLNLTINVAVNVVFGLLLHGTQKQIFEPSHRDRKCIVLLVSGVLFCEDPTKKLNNTDVIYYYIC